MTISEWYLNATTFPIFNQTTTNYIASLQPFVADHWKNTSAEMRAFKKNLLEQLIKLQDNRCAYCGLGLSRSLVDREHFVSKGKPENKPEFMFHPRNLFAACAFCNRILKGRKKSIATFDADYDKCTFKIIHPYFDVAPTEIKFIKNRRGLHVVAQAITPKGEATIKFFELDKADITAKRAGYIAEKQELENISADTLANIKSISCYRPT